MELEVGDVVLCTVDRTAGTVVFVKIDGYGEGSIITSEIAPGRIRNLREYVVPKKKIVCKVLRVTSNGNIDLSLRRVTQKEKKEVLEQYKQEKSYKSVLKSILGEKAEEVIKKIEEKERLFDFLQDAKEDSKELEKITGKEDTKKILDIIKTQKSKTAILKKEFNLTTKDSNGLNLIKKLLGNLKGVEIKYISAGKYSIKTQADDIKTADNQLKEILKDLEEKAKKLDFEFSVKEK
jgi:translation initiation factor 2 subunit 1